MSELTAMCSRNDDILMTATTNPIEKLNGKFTNYSKKKLSFPNDDAVMKSVHLGIVKYYEEHQKP